MPITGMPLRKIDFINRLLALAEPVPLTDAILITKSLMREDAMLCMFCFGDSSQARSGDFRILRLHGR